MDTKRTPLYKKKRFWAGILLAQFVLFFVLSRAHFAVQFFSNFFEWQKEIHQQVFAWIPFSIGDVFYSFLGVFLSYQTVCLFSKRRRNKAIVRVLIALNVVYFLYQIFWGMLYFQEPLVDKLSEKEPTIKEAQKLALLYLEKCKATRKLVAEDKNGVFIIADQKSLEEAILMGQENIPPSISKKKRTGVISIKPSLFGCAMSYTGILGYYNPFSAEAQYNSQLPSSYLPFTMSHESAHQLGFAREQEANFVGYLIGKDSDDLGLRYSTQYFVLKSLLQAIVEEDPDFVEAVLARYSAGMKRDRRFEKEFVSEHSGVVDAFFGMANNVFLKTNQQEGSVTYSYFVDLLLRYERP